jgi:endonuclease YncB( thermonuclease family)
MGSLTVIGANLTPRSPHTESLIARHAPNEDEAMRQHGCLLTITALLFSLPAHAEILRGRVARVVDSDDAVYVLDVAKAQHTIRLAGIDAPERGQAFGRRAKERLVTLVAGQALRVEWHKKDRWGRLIATVWAASPECALAACPKTLDRGLARLTLGVAWHYKTYPSEQTAEDRERYAFAEEDAKARRAGRWQNTAPMQHWEWRKR